MKHICKILLPILLALGLIIGIFIFAEEISALKHSLYSHIVKGSVSTESTEATEPTEETVSLEALYDSFPVFTHSEDAWYQNNHLVYHAGGGIDGLAYTNSKEAIEANLPHANVMEIDFFYTSDHQLVCIHSWSYITGSDIPMTTDQYRDHKVFGRYTTVDAQYIIDIMEENKDLYVIIDTKEVDCVSVIRDLIDLADNRKDITDRFVIQLFDRGIKAQLTELYPFAEHQFLFTCYKFSTDPDDILRVCMEENIAIVTVDYRTWSADVVERFAQKGILIFEHTVNRLDYAHEAMSRGVYGLYTDFLTVSDLSQ